MTWSLCSLLILPYTFSMTQVIYPASNIRIPANEGEVKIIQKISDLSGFISAITALALFLLWGMNVFLFVGVISACLFLLIQKKKYRTLPLSKVQKMPSVIMSLFIILFGVLSIQSSQSNFFYGFALCFFGVSMVLRFTRLIHRHHFSQLILFFTILLIALSFYKFVYVAISTQSLITQANSLIHSALFIICCQSLLLSKPDRGFLGMLTLDSPSSRLALRFLVYLIVVPPVMSFTLLVAGYLKLFDKELTIPLLIIFLNLMSLTVNWLNMKLLYKFERERYLIGEALRVNNIQLEIESEDLNVRVSKLQKEKDDVIRKVNNSQSLQEIVSSQR